MPLLYSPRPRGVSNEVSALDFGQGHVWRGFYRRLAVIHGSSCYCLRCVVGRSIDKQYTLGSLFNILFNNSKEIVNASQMRVEYGDY